MKQYDFKQFIVGKELGSGGFGLAKTARIKDDDKEYVMKFYFNTNDLTEELLNRERNALTEISKINHTNIVKCYGHCYEGENKEYPVYLFEYCNGDFLKKMEMKEEGIEYQDENYLKSIFSQIVAAIGYLHSHTKLVHRDIKPDNFLMKTKFHVLLSDFGLSTILYKDEIYSNNRIGCYYFKNEKELSEGYDQSHDYYSLGKSFLFISLFDKYKLEYRTIPALKKDKTFSAEFKDLIEKLCKDRHERIKYEDIIKHSWVTSRVITNKQFQFNNKPNIVEEKKITISDLYNILQESHSVKCDYLYLVSYFDSKDLYPLTDTDQKRPLYTVEFLYTFKKSEYPNVDHEIFSLLSSLYDRLFKEYEVYMLENSIPTDQFNILKNDLKDKDKDLIVHISTIIKNIEMVVEYNNRLKFSEKLKGLGIKTIEEKLEEIEKKNKAINLRNSIGKLQKEIISQNDLCKSLENLKLDKTNKQNNLQEFELAFENMLKNPKYLTPDQQMECQDFDNKLNRQKKKIEKLEKDLQNNNNKNIPKNK